MDVNLSAPVIAREEIRIDADVQAVWDVLSDIEHWPAWNKAVRSLTLHGSVAPGTSFEWKAGPGTIKSRLAEVDPPHRIVWTGVTLGIKAVDAFSFEASEGGTLVRQAESWGGPPRAAVPRAHGAHAAREPARRPALPQGGGGAPGRRRRGGLTADPRPYSARNSSSGVPLRRPDARSPRCCGSRRRRGRDGRLRARGRS